MKYTPLQRKVLREKSMSKVIYRAMFKSEGQLGYSSKGKRNHYDINIASDAPDKEVKAIVLMHELGHLYYNHVDAVDLKKEFKDIKEIFKKNDIPFSRILVYGGPMSFVNICMDFQINTTILTIANNRYMDKAGVGICSPEKFKVELLGDFREYYEPMILRLKDMKSEDDLSEEEKKALRDLMKDLPSKPSAFDGDFDEELQDALMDEDYQEGNSKATSDNKSGESTVGKEGDKNDSENHSTSSDLSEGGEGQGQSHSVRGNVEIVNNTSDEIRKFLKSIVNSSMEFNRDSLRHHNHGTRRNNYGILYSSRKRKMDVNTKKLGILIDVSGSMDATNVLKALSTLKNDMNCVSSDSKVVTWDTSFCEEFDIRKIPDSVRLGGGTDMARGAQYLAENKFDTIVVFSDMGTDIPSLTKVIKDYHLDCYSIVVDSNDYLRNNGEYQHYVSSNKKVIELK